MKHCFGCGERKPIEAFSRNKSRPDGLQTQCKTCNAARFAANRENVSVRHRAYLERTKEARTRARRAYYEKNAEALRAIASAYQREHAAEKQAYNTAYRAKNLEAIKAQQRKYDTEHREARRAQHSAWRKANADRVREQGRKDAALRRANRRSAQSIELTVEMIAARMAVFGSCWICGSPEWSEVDHVKPLVAGGPHILANLRPTCTPCNRSKGGRWPLGDWLSERRSKLLAA